MRVACLASWIRSSAGPFWFSRRGPGRSQRAGLPVRRPRRGCPMIESVDDVPLLVRREIEARIIAPFVDALAQRFGREPVLEVLRETILSLARQQGAESQKRTGGKDVGSFSQVTQRWTEGGAL